VSVARKRAALTRRTLLLGACALSVAGVGAVGGGYLLGSAGIRARWIEALLRRNLPGIEIEPGSLARFVQEMLATDLLVSRKRALVASADLAAPQLTARVGSVRRFREEAERKIVTDFLMGSNFFRVANPAAEPIVYYGRPAVCPNPFARL
jgi:hypothetical protein